MAAELKVKSGGSWRTITNPEVKVSGTWRAIQTIEVKVAGVWEEVFAPGIIVSPVNDQILSLDFLGGTVYAYLKIDNDGIEYRNATSGSPAFGISRGNWLDKGAAGDVWVQRVLDSGTLNGADPGAGRLNLGTDRIFGNKQIGVGDTSTTVTYNYYDAASGGNLLGSATVLHHCLVTML